MAGIGCSETSQLPVSAPLGGEVARQFFLATASEFEQCIDDIVRDIHEARAVQASMDTHPDGDRILLASNSELPAMSALDYASTSLKKVCQDATRTHSSRQLGHMTAQLPLYHTHLARIITAMNQNTVKVETSASMTVIERSVLVELHRLCFNLDDDIYKVWLESADNTCIGSMCSGGTVANMTAMWAARNQALPNCHTQGLAVALRKVNATRAVIVGSRLMHYSLTKTASLLGLGTTEGVVLIDYDDSFSMNLAHLQETLRRLRSEHVVVVAVIAIAGSTEVGSHDDIAGIVGISRRFGHHVHVDGAWGGAFIFSKTHRPRLLAGLELADSITIDGHKQLLTPMGLGITLFRDLQTASNVQHSSEYIIRNGSMDAGRFSLEGSRPATALHLHANLRILGATGYASILDRCVALTAYLASAIHARPSLQLVAPPQSNICLFRYVGDRDHTTQTSSKEANADISALNVLVHERQKARGDYFFSRTRVFVPRLEMYITAIRSVLLSVTSVTSDIDAALDELIAISREIEAKED